MEHKLWMKAQELARQNCHNIYDDDWDELDKYQKEDCVWYEYENLVNEKESTDMGTKLICPNCGTEMKLPEKSELVMGVTLSKETGGTHVLQADIVKNNNIDTTKLNNKENKMNTRENRMVALNNAGVDINKFFNVTLPNGDVVKMTMENGVPVVVNDVSVSDPIINQIIEDGYVRNTKLHRRFVMAHMFRMLNYKSYKRNESGYDACLRNNYGYMYQFDMMLEEVRVLSKLEVRDLESFNERKHFFTKKVVVETCTDYLEKLKAHIDNQKSKNCKGVPYKRVKGQNIFVADLDKKVFGPILRQIWRINNATLYSDIYRELKKFVDSMIKLPWDTKKCKVWIDAFKGSGSYYTLKNLVMYHDCKIFYERGFVFAGTEAVKFIQSKLDEYQYEGWRYMAMLKKCIADNHFDFNQRMKEIYRK